MPVTDDVGAALGAAMSRTVTVRIDPPRRKRSSPAMIAGLPRREYYRRRTARIRAEREAFGGGPGTDTTP